MGEADRRQPLALTLGGSHLACDHLSQNGNGRDRGDQRKDPQASGLGLYGVANRIADQHTWLEAQRLRSRQRVELGAQRCQVGTGSEIHGHQRVGHTDLVAVQQGGRGDREGVRVLELHRTIHDADEHDRHPRALRIVHRKSEVRVLGPA